MLLLAVQMRRMKMYPDIGLDKVRKLQIQKKRRRAAAPSVLETFIEGQINPDHTEKPHQTFNEGFPPDEALPVSIFWNPILQKRKFRKLTEINRKFLEIKHQKEIKIRWRYGNIKLHHVICQKTDIHWTTKKVADEKSEGISKRYVHIP